VDLLEAARAGIERVAVPEDVRRAAFTNLQRWWTEPPFEPYREAIAHLLEHSRFDEIVDAFRQVLPFGTGGRRGPVGVGPNRINPWTVSACAQGHVRWLRRRGRPSSVVVAYDVRRFPDLRGLYGDVASPIRVLSSRDLAELAARVYAANGVTCHLLPPDADYLLSTPELSFTVRELGADGGLNVSASHNPPDDNGVKVYDRRGAQLVPPFDEELLDEVAAVGDAALVSLDEGVKRGLVVALPRALHERFIDTNAALAPAGPRAISVLYTPLHGTGIVHEVLRRAGFACRLHEPQAAPDGRFPTVPDGVANPEMPQAMAHALAAAGDAELVFGTDPDADRIGAEVKHHGEWVHLGGNDIAALVAHAAVARDAGGRRPLVIITEVTSVLVSRIAVAGGAVVVDDLLVGFKYVAEVLRALEEEGRYGDIRASDVTFVAGAEESHGVLVTDRIRDKDAAGGALYLAALAAAERERGRTLVDLLEELRFRHGYVRTAQLSVSYPGATGQEKLSELLQGMRAAPPEELAGRRVISFTDHRNELGRYGRTRSHSDRAARNVLVLRLAGGVHDDGLRVILRPSGTEPKLKVYVEVQGAAGLEAHARAEVDRTLEAVRKAVGDRLR
jgi:phosphoglucomutase/phosphomannomutase